MDIDYEKARKVAGDDYPPTDAQILFAYHYAEHGNGMKAIRDSGYHHSTPGSQSSAAYRLLRKKKIAKLVEYFRKELGKAQLNLI